MQLTIFKPNPNSTGGLVKLRIAKLKNDKKDVWERVLFAEFVPQKGWNDSNKSGSFDSTKKRTIAINITEAGEILHSMEKEVPFQNYHKSGDRSCWVKFAPFNKKRTFGQEGEKGFWEGQVANFALGYSEKGKGVSIPITPGEAFNLKMLLESYIKESMAIDAKEADKQFKERENAPKKEPKKDPVEELFEDEDNGDFDDVPFS